MNFLQCDAEGCDHVEEVDDIKKEDIGKPCPKCGANLLTEEDFDLFEKVVRPSRDILKIFEALSPPDGEKAKISISGHKGTISMKLPD